MYSLLDKKQTNNIWIYTIVSDSNIDVFKLKSTTELTDEELNNLVNEKLFDYECKEDYSDFADKLINHCEVRIEQNGKREGI